MQQWRWLVIGLLACLVAAATAAAEASKDPELQRIVAIGDIHGALEPFELILRRAGLIDEQRSWIGGRDILVQTGDLLDRGADAKVVVELLQNLQKQAKRQGGKVIVLLGNHEALNLAMSLRDVTPEMVEPFAGKRSEKRRDRYCDRLFRRAEKKSGSSPPPDKERFVQSCRSDVPIGMLEYIEALSPESSFGRWLRRLPAAAQVGGHLFLHGGLSPEWADLSVDEINDKTRQELEQFDRLRKGLLSRDLIVQTSALAEITGVARALRLVVEERGVEIENPPLEALEAASEFEQWALFDPDGPLWFRGYSKWNDDELRAFVLPLLEQRGIKGIVVGHTPRKSKSIETRLDGRVLLIDTGMLSEVYGGRPAALEIIGHQLTAIYPQISEPLN